MKYATIKEAAQEWVKEMNVYPVDMLEILVKADEGGWHEITTPCKGDRVYYLGMEGEIAEVIFDNEAGFDIYKLALDDGTEMFVDAEDFEVLHDDFFPMWGWMWSFKDSLDEGWLTDHNGIKLMSECGFRIYESDKWGYFFGIDGCGYDFYTNHWCPLYKARGLQWHESAEA